MEGTRYYVTPGDYTCPDRLVEDACLVMGVPSYLWERYLGGEIYLTIWKDRVESQYGHIRVENLDWALDRGYLPFNQNDEILI